MTPSQTVHNIIKRIYTLSKLANNKVGIKILKRMMIPPIVGVPFFCCSPANPNSLTVSPICFLCKNKIIFLPYTVAINKESKIAIAIRNVKN